MSWRTIFALIRLKVTYNVKYGLLLRVCEVNYQHVYLYIQGDSWVMGFTVADNLLGVCEQKGPVNIGPILDAGGDVVFFFFQFS